MSLVYLSDIVGCAALYDVQDLGGVHWAIEDAAADDTPIIFNVLAHPGMELLLAAIEVAAREIALPAAILVSDCHETELAVASVRYGANALSGDAAQVIAEATGVEVVEANLVGSSEGKGRASEVLAEARPWKNVQHLIFFNATVEDDEARKRMETGVETLSQIPGVRYCMAGGRVAGAEDYRYCWVVTFASETVVETYKHHSDHMAYADEHFRPMAGGRITIDFEPVREI